MKINPCSGKARVANLRDSPDIIIAGTGPLPAAGSAAAFGLVHFGGHLNHIDHGTGMHVRSTDVTGYTVIGGAPGTATVTEQDNGEPGWQRSRRQQPPDSKGPPGWMK